MWLCVHRIARPQHHCRVQKHSSWKWFSKNVLKEDLQSSGNTWRSTLTQFLILVKNTGILEMRFFVFLIYKPKKCNFVCWGVKWIKQMAVKLKGLDFSKKHYFRHLSICDFFLGFQTQIFKLLSFLSDAMAAFMFRVLSSVWVSFLYFGEEAEQKEKLWEEDMCRGPGSPEHLCEVRASAGFPD